MFFFIESTKVTFKAFVHIMAYIAYFLDIWGRFWSILFCYTVKIGFVRVDQSLWTCQNADKQLKKSGSYCKLKHRAKDFISRHEKITTAYQDASKYSGYSFVARYSLCNEKMNAEDSPPLSAPFGTKKSRYWFSFFWKK